MEYRQFVYTPKKGLKLSSVDQDSYQAILAMVNEVVSLATGYRIERISSHIDCRQERCLSITYCKVEEQKPEHPDRSASESLHWTAYFKDSETGNAIAQYSSGGDINYYDTGLPWKENFRGNTPIEILFRKADASGFPYDVIVKEVIYS